MTSLTSEKHRALLADFERALGREGFPARLRPADDRVPLDLLLVELAGDGRDPVRLELSFLPGLEGQLGGQSLLQCFAGLGVVVAEDRVAELARTIVALNGRLPLVGFGCLHPSRGLCFRHVLMLSDAEDSAPEIVVRTTWMVAFVLHRFGDRVAGVATGRLGLAEALADDPVGPEGAGA